MIFATVGTDHHHFDRVLAWVAAYVSDHEGVSATVQHGSTAPPSGVEAFPMLDVDSLTSTLRRSDVVVCHGGPGSIMEARATGHVPIVVPRERQFGEHVDDHQVRFSARLAQDGMIVLARDEATFRAAVTAQLAEDRRHDLGSTDAVVEAAINRFAALVDELVGVPEGGPQGWTTPS